ncbi:MAG: phosphatidate cytidylyltransferase [Betaproteobacteria bacterium]
MTPMQQTLDLFIGIGLVLLAASIAGALLKRYVARGASHGLVDYLNARIKAWWVMVLLIGIALAFGRAGVLLLFFFVSFAALREFITLTYTRRADHDALATSFYVILPLQYLLVWTQWYGLYSIFIPVYAFLLLPILAVLAGDTTRFLERTAKMQWGLMICVFCVSHVPALLNLKIPDYEGRNALLIVFLVVVVQSGDVFRYVWSRLLGRRRIAPAIAPSHTVEGLACGVLAATALGASLWWITPFGVGQAALIALGINAMGVIGGLVMSAIKHDRGVRDWGDAAEGRAGMLDRLDSVVFAAPVFFHLVRFGWT